MCSDHYEDERGGVLKRSPVSSEQRPGCVVQAQGGGSSRGNSENLSVFEINHPESINGLTIHSDL